MSVTKLDSGQCIKHSYSDADVALKVVPVSSTAFAVEVAASDGDSIMAVGTSDGTTTGTQTVIKTTAGVVSVDGSAVNQPVRQIFNSRSDTYTVPANGVTIDVSTTLAKAFSVQVTGTGAAATAWSVVVEGSLDNVTFTTLITHASGVDADGAIVSSGASYYPVKYFRTRLVSVTLTPATDLVVNVVGMN